MSKAGIIFQTGNFSDPAGVAASFEAAGDENIDEAKGFMDGGVQPSEAKHVGVVVLSAEGGLVLKVDKGGADPLDLVGGNAHSNPRRAGQDSDLASTGRNILADQLCVIRVIHRIPCPGTVVNDLMSFLLKVLKQGRAQQKGPMIKSNTDFHLRKFFLR